MTKHSVTLIFIITLLGGCSNDFSTESPDVDIFVNKLKTNTYNNTEKYGNEGKVRLMMPKFTKEHIPLLLEHTKDTTHIKNFPTNPLSYRNSIPEERDYYILGEALLWIVEGIRRGSTYGSLDPYLMKFENYLLPEYSVLTISEILEVRELYVEWWINSKNVNAYFVPDPLKSTNYYWH